MCVGQFIHALDSEDVHWPAVILRRFEDQVLVHYLNWSTCFDVWLNTNSEKILMLADMSSMSSLMDGEIDVNEHPSIGSVDERCKNVKEILRQLLLLKRCSMKEFVDYVQMPIKRCRKWMECSEFLPIKYRTQTLTFILSYSALFGLGFDANIEHWLGSANKKQSLKRRNKETVVDSIFTNPEKRRRL